MSDEEKLKIDIVHPMTEADNVEALLRLKFSYIGVPG
jgi:hypothetical protein